MIFLNRMVRSFLIILLASGSVSHAQDQTKQRVSGRPLMNLENSAIELNSETKPYPFHQIVMLGAIRTYQILISPSKGSFCPMHPHCSLYGYQAFKRYNPVRAFLMTADRLHRCGHDLDNYEPVEVAGFVRFLDPVQPSLTDKASNPNADTWSEIHTQVSLNTPRNADTSVRSSSDDGHSEDSRLFRFAEILQFESNYDRAITEYRRLLSYFPNSRYEKQALKSIFYCYYKAEQYLTAIHWGQDLLEKGTCSPDEDELEFFIGASYFKVGNYPRARNCFTQVANSSNKDFREKSLLLKGLSYTKEANWEDAERSFARVSPDSEFSDKARQCEKLSQDGKKLGLKSPAIAGVLAVIPGLGYLYDGYEQTALSSFIVNGLFIWGTFEAFRKDNQSVGTMLGILSFGWYAGNIYGSVISAQRRNIKSRDDLLLKFDIGFQF